MLTHTQSPLFTLFTDVHARMLQLGWDKRPGVTILFGRWQDVLPQLLQQRFDGVFFDTYG